MIQAMNASMSGTRGSDQAMAALAVADAPGLTVVDGPALAVDPVASLAVVEPVVAVLAHPAAAARADLMLRMEDLVRQYGRLIAVMVRRVGRQAPPHVREDIQQRVLIALWKQLRRDQAITHPTSYIYRTAVRETVRVVRQEAARAQEPMEADGPAGLVSSPDDPYVTLARKEKMRHIRAAIAAIAPERRQAVWAHLSGFEVTEIMARYGWSYQKTRNLIARGMADVREILQQSGLGPRGRTLASDPPPVRLNCATPEPIKSSAERARQAKLRVLKLRGRQAAVGVRKPTVSGQTTGPTTDHDHRR